MRRWTRGWAALALVVLFGQLAARCPFNLSDHASHRKETALTDLLANDLSHTGARIRVSRGFDEFADAPRALCEPRGHRGRHA